MTIRTVQWLKDHWQGRVPPDWTDDLLDTMLADEDKDTVLLTTSDVGSASGIWVNTDGSDTSGDGSVIRPFATVAKGLSQVSATRQTVIVFPGTYTENLTWPTRTGIHLVCIGGHGGVKIADASDGGTAVIKIAPGTAATSWEAYLDDVQIDANGTGLKVDPASSLGTFSVYLHQVDFIQTLGTHAARVLNTGTHCMITEWTSCDVGGLVYFNPHSPDERHTFRMCELAAGMESGTATPLGGTMEFDFEYVEVLHESVSGGDANQRINSLFCWTRTGETLATLDSTDLGGSHTENIVN